MPVDISRCQQYRAYDKAMVEIIFISSSRIKFTHIEYGLRGSRYFITPQRNYGIGYVEPRIYVRDELLKQSYVDARKRFEKYVSNADDKFFMIEDTSVIVDALSDDHNEVPGLDVKYWMQEHTFESVDRLLKEHGDNRACTVRSDIVLHLPKKLRDKYKKEYLVFTGSQRGAICKEEKEFGTNPLYSWLDNKTFNKWFVPDPYIEQDIPISLLDVDEASKYDFRLFALKKMIEFLDKEDLEKFKKDIKAKYTPNLFESSTFLLLGPTCTGKTTLSQYLSEKYGYYHIEASDFMYLEYYNRHGVESTIPIGDFAQKMLREDPVIVAKQVVAFCKKLHGVPIVISGFRAQEEIEYFAKNHPITTCSIYIETEQKLRYERCIKRNRGDMADNFINFQKKDAQQFEMGLAEIEKSIQNKIYNNETIEKFYARFESKNLEYIKSNIFVPSHSKKQLRLEDFILLSLKDENDRYFTTTEIANLINNKFKLQKNKNNVSRYFNQYFHPYFEIKVESGVKKYRLNTTGTSQANYLLESDLGFDK